MITSSTYVIDRDDPRAPPMEVWERLTPEEQEWVVGQLPTEVPWVLNPPDGDDHYEGKDEPLHTLRRHFRTMKRKVYLTCDIAVYYPGEAMFSPDLLAVLDAEDRRRSSWVVAKEKRGLDFVLEVHVLGDRYKDFRYNVERYARLGIPEYFIYEPLRSLLRGFRLPEAGATVYESIVPQQGRWPSRILDLDLSVQGDRLRFFVGQAPLPENEELVERLQQMVDEQVHKRQEEERRAEEAEEKLRNAEEKIAELQEEIERLKRQE
jgi:hypothetical protein